MDNSPEEIRQQMEQTRHDLQEKLQTLEHQVKETVVEATETVSTVKETVEAVKDTMQETASAVQETVHDTVDAVKETVEETVESVRETMDLRRQAEEHPWAVFAGAVAVGFVGGKLLLHFMPDVFSVPSFGHGARPQSAEHDHGPRKAHHHRGNGHGDRKAAKSSRESSQGGGLLGLVTQHFGKELSTLQSMAVGAAGNVLREALASSAPESLVNPLREVVDGITQKLGGKPLEGSILSGPGGEESRPVAQPQSAVAQREYDPRRSRFDPCD
jgi:ElaB/YqjD/DUF883 family membrane-anchored ribosome-binding protein